MNYLFFKQNFGFIFLISSFMTHTFFYYSSSYIHLTNYNTYDILFENELVYTGSKIIGLVANKVLKEDIQRLE